MLYCGGDVFTEVFYLDQDRQTDDINHESTWLSCYCHMRLQELLKITPTVN